MPDQGSNRGSRNTNALAVVAGALIALIAVLAFLALISHRSGAQEPPAAAAAATGADAVGIASGGNEGRAPLLWVVVLLVDRTDVDDELGPLAADRPAIDVTGRAAVDVSLGSVG